MVSMNKAKNNYSPPPPAALDQLPLTCSVPTAAKLLGIGRATAYKAAADGSIPSIRIGRCIRVPSAALRRLLEEGTQLSAGSESPWR